jgi:hypothetical protein
MTAGGGKDKYPLTGYSAGQWRKQYKSHMYDFGAERTESPKWFAA